MEPSESVFPRHLEQSITEHMACSPVVVIGGVRSGGKTTLLKAVARDHGVQVFDLDRKDVRGILSQDIPGFIASSARPICVDEFQRELDLLDGIKADLNQATVPGSYVLTGSIRYTTLPKASQSLTGRAHIMTLWPLSQGELRRHRETFIDTVFNEPELLGRVVESKTSRVEYEEMVLAGGFPLALERPAGKLRTAWFRDFINLVIRRDILPLRNVRDRQVLADLIRHLAAQTGQVLDVTGVATRVGQPAQLVSDLISLLESVFIIHKLEAYGVTLSASVRRRPKVHIVDSGLAASLLGVTPHKLRALNPPTMSEFGHLTETFVVNELMKQAGWAETFVEFKHFRVDDKREVDLVIEADDGRIIGIEVKAGSKVSEQDFAGMRALRDKLGDRFVAGVLVNLGTLNYRFDEKLYVSAADRLWA